MALSEGIICGQFEDAESSDSTSSSEEEIVSESCPKHKELDASIRQLLTTEDDYECNHEEATYDKYAKYYDDEPKQGCNAQQISSKTASFQPQKKLLSQNSFKVNIGHSKMGGSGNDSRRKDKASRATTAQVLDPRTMLIINKMLSQGHFDRITGSISVGKEANVFRAEKYTDEGTQYLALKVYKTSILTFKNRSKYVQGDFRLRQAYHGSNPRKMVKTWAEKEFRNLSRMYQAGIPCPQPLLLKGHLCLMGFIGSEDGAAAPLLLNASLSENKLHEIYLDLVLFMRRLYADCKLVHADLSEFNILYHAGKAIIIDVSQAVEHEHPNALVFLRKDCTNITMFFRHKGVATMLVKELFDFITDLTITAKNLDAVLESAMEKAVARSHTGMSDKEQVDEEVFKSEYLPRTLEQLVNFEKMWEKQMMGEVQDSSFSTVVGMKADMSGAQEIPRLLEDKLHVDPSSTVEDEDSEDEIEEEEDNGKSENGKKKAQAGRPKNETTEEKKARKQAVKDVRKEKLQKKLKKHTKKKAEKIGRLK